jgi:hypothetical protein
MDATLLCEIIEGARLTPQSYGGRGRSGQPQCVGVTVEAITPALADMIECCEHVNEAAELVRGHRTDNMGRGYIIYWPRVAWEGDEE